MSEYAHLSREQLVDMCQKAERYIDEAKRALGDWYYTGRPLPDAIKDILSHYEGQRGGEEV